MVNQRLYPSRFHDRYYHLTLFRKTIESVAKDHLDKNKSITLLDFGCGTMPYKPIFEQYVTQYFGLDLPDNQVADFSVDSNGKTSLPDGFSDVILSTQVLEHVEQPMQYLNECERLLKPDGLIILSTHGYWMYHPNPQDLWRWTSDGLKKTVSEAGFEIVDFRGMMGLTSIAVHLLQDGIIVKIPTFVRPLFAFIMQNIVMLSDKLHSSSEKDKDACVFVVIAKKKGKLKEQQNHSFVPLFKTETTQSQLKVRSPESPVLCVISPNKNAYSETFIRAHIERLPAHVKTLYGGWFPRYTEDDKPLLSSTLVNRIKLAACRRLLRFSPQYFQNKPLKSFLRKNKVNAVLAEYGPTGASVKDVCSEMDVPLIVHFHGFDAYYHVTLKEFDQAYKHMFTKAAAIIAVSHDMENKLLTLGVPREKLFYSSCGVDTSLFSGASPATSQLIFVAVGRFVDKKAPHLTLLAFKQVLDAFPDAKLIMIGDGELWEACKQLAKALNIDASVEFRGPRSHTEVAATMQMARAFIQHSMTASYGDSEGTPVAILEACAAGLPVVSTYHAGIKDVIIDGETGFLVNEGDVKGMAECMKKLANDSALANLLGNNARERIRSEFSMEKSIGNLWGIIENAIKKHQKL